jgi:nucleoside-diphosphate-sugar epimerase
MRVLLTGATGFAGHHILDGLLAAGIHVRAPVRRDCASHPLLETPRIDDLATADWSSLCDGVEMVVHAAAYAHDDRADPAMIMRVNRDGAAALAAAAGAVGARFIFLSSIRAQAGVSSPVPLKDGDPPHPDGPYGAAKLAAEQAIATHCPHHINLRLAPLYGAGVKGNLATLFALANTRLPLPFASLAGKRSLLAVGSLAALVVDLVQNPPDLTGSFLVAEPGPLALGEIIAEIRKAQGKSAGLVAVPAAWIEAGCRLLNRPLLWRRIGESLIVDDDLALYRRFPDRFTPSATGLAAWARMRHG